MPNFFPEGIPLPVGDLISAPFWDYCKQHEFRVQRCARCGTYRMPPQPTCFFCQSFDSVWVKSRGIGEVFTYEIVHSPPHPATRSIVPYNIVVVELEDCGSVRFTSNLVDVKNEDIHIGMKVEVAWEDSAPDVTVPRFRPVQG